MQELEEIQALRHQLLNARNQSISSSGSSSVSVASDSDDNLGDDNAHNHSDDNSDNASDREDNDDDDNDEDLDENADVNDVVDGQDDALNDNAEVIVDVGDNPPDVFNEEEREQYVIQALREWACSGGVLSRSKVDEILGKLSHVFPNMPLSYKTLLQTVGHVDVDRGDHKFWYKGIDANLDRLELENYLEHHGKIELDINMDGLPLAGNNLKFWPILGKLVGSEHPPFIIAIYCGAKDPSDVDMFLGDFIVEVETLLQHGYEYNGHFYDFGLRNFILDAPARAFVKCCISHTGYGACEKCTVVGVHEEGRLNFSHLGAECRLRSDQSYIDQEDRLHHTGVSPLQFLNIGMVSSFRLDTMHLVHKGCFLRFLEALLTWGGYWNPTANDINVISNKLVGLADSCPLDFNRKPKKFEFYYKYKATELRRLLMYDGCVVFKDVLHEDVYSLFLLLHCGIFILASPYLLHQLADFAEACLQGFVQFSAQIFGNHFVSYNVHSTLHLVAECRNFGVIENFSAFCYENCLKSIKETLLTGNLPLEQFIKRDSEWVHKEEVILASNQNEFELGMPHPNPNNEIDGEQFKQIRINKTTFRLNQSDACFLTRNGAVVILENIIRRDGNIFFQGKRFTQQDDIYDYPINSSQLGIFKVWGLRNEEETFPIEEVFAKCWLMPQNDDTFVSIPLAHTTPLIH